MKTLTVIAMLLIGAVFSVQWQEQKANLTPCPAGWTAGPDADWKIFWNDALAEARQSGKKIFALSTGSDWCGWCMKLKKEVLTTPDFKNFAKKNLVLLYLDSPRKPLPEAQTLHNRTICRELGLSGGVPCAAVFAADARQLGVLSGGGYTASNYVERLEKIITEKGELPKSGQPSKIFTEGYVEAEKEPVKWKYEVVDDVVVLGRGGKGHGPAVEGDAIGALVIPEKIDGKPVRVIGNCAFEGRSGLTSVTIPESVTNIGRSAFNRCSGLKSLNIPSGLTSIGGFAFFGCEGLTSLTLPKRMTTIGEFAFRSCSGLSSMTIPEGVTRIESATFLFCTGLKSVTIPASVESIRPGAFAHCDNLSAFTVDGSNPAFCSKNGMICSKDGSQLVVGVNGNVTIPDGVEVIKSCAFDDLAGLLTVKMPASVRTVENDAFTGCSALKSFSVDGSNPSYCSRNGLLCSKDGKTVVVGVNGEVKIPKGVTTIKDRAFHDFAGVKSIEIPESVTRVGRYAFDGCEALADADGFVVVKGILFGYFGKASSVEIPETVRIIGSGAFTWRCGFKSVTIPSSVTNIEGSAFYCSKGLESLTIPSSVTQIEHGAFDHCTGLKTVILPSSVTSIRGYAFEGCTSLVDVDIQGSGVKVEARAFPEQIRSKLPDLSKPVGPIRVIVGKDEGENRNNGVASSQPTKDATDFESWQKGPSDAWFVKWDDAVAESKKTKKPIFVLSTGSDWCGWCIRLRKNVLSKPEFEAFAKKNLVLLYLDSPSKTPLCSEQKKHNQEVSRRLSLGGGVPNASVVTADGKNLGAIGGGGLELEDYIKKLEGILKCSQDGDGGVSALSPSQSAEKTPPQFMATSGTDTVPAQQPVMVENWILKNARAEDVGRIVETASVGLRNAFSGADLKVEVDGELNRLTIRTSSEAMRKSVGGIIKCCDAPVPDANYVEKTYVLKYISSECAARAINTLLGEGVATAVDETTPEAVKVCVPKWLSAKCQYVIECMDLKAYEWNVTAVVWRIPDVKNLQEARRRMREAAWEPSEVWQWTNTAEDGRSCEMIGRFDRDDPATAFRLSVVPRWSGENDVSIKWMMSECDQAEQDVRMSGASVLCGDQPKEICGWMRSESRGFFGLFGSGVLDTAYLLQITVSDKDRLH